MIKAKKDLVGQKFNRWTVIEQAEDYIESSGKHRVNWKCICDCGTIRNVIEKNLKNGTSKSCGCLRKEKVSNIGKQNKKYNTYDLSGEYGIGYTSKGEEFWFDKEDFDLIKDYCWFINSGYVMSRGNNNKFIKFHRLLYPNAETVDHIRHRTFDNRRSELRVATKSQNQMNTIIRTDNTSGYKGVSWDKSENKWAAYINIDKKFHKKRFANLKDAIEQRKKWEEKYYGEYSYDNSMKEVD